MTREEEIVRVADRNYSGYSERRLGFMAGATWADKTMLDRACKWLENRHNIEKCLNILTSRTEDLSKAFRQAMEGVSE